MPKESKASSTSKGRGGKYASVAKFMKSDNCKNVVLMLGAGISTSAGIPDFRSPDTGLYANLARLNLPFPEAVFEINFFRNNPVPFYTLANELYPGKFRPTLTHSFIHLLDKKSLLHTCFTQNIDTLERRAGVSADKIVEAHGSFATQRCIECKAPYDDAKMKEVVMKMEIPKCEKCKGLVKPDIVFFGEGLPREFFTSIGHLAEADLLIVMGTSLQVQPFASLHERVPTTCKRVLINLDHVGEFGDRKDDIVFLGKCDDVVKDLAKELGWEGELQKAWEATADAIEDSTREKGNSNVQSEIDKLTEDLGHTLAVASWADDPEKETASKGEGKGQEPVLQIPEGKSVPDTKSGGGASDASTSSDNPKSQSPSDGKL